MSHSNRRNAIQFVLIFFALTVALTLLIRRPQVDENIILPYTEWLASLTGTLFSLAGLSVQASGTFLIHETFSVNIRKGCDGIVATMVLLSACVAFPSSWIHKVRGLIGGFLLIFILNLFRILVLFLLGVAGWMDAFNFVHTYVAQFAVIASAMVFWIYWAGKERPRAS